MSTLANDLTSFNSAVSGILSGPLASLLSALTSTQTAAYALPPTSSINTTLVSVVNAVNAVWGDLNTSLAALNQTNYDLCSILHCPGGPSHTFDLNVVSNSLTQITEVTSLAVCSHVSILSCVCVCVCPQNAAGIIPCIFAAIDEMLSLNISVISLPSSISGVTNLGSKINDTLSPAIEQVNSALSEISTANTTMMSYNVSQYLIDVTNAQVEPRSVLDSAWFDLVTFLCVVSVGDANIWFVISEPGLHPVVVNQHLYSKPKPRFFCHVR